MGEDLRFVLAQVCDWLKFGEAKNAALVALVVAAVFGLFQSVTDPLAADHPWRSLYFGSMTLQLTISGLCSLLSFLPQTRIPFVLRHEPPKPKHNLIFFGDIAKYDPASYLDEVRRRAGATGAPDPLDAQLAEQIVVNSRIAATKYTWFKFALWFALSAVATPVAALAAYVFLHPQEKPS